MRVYPPLTFNFNKGGFVMKKTIKKLLLFLMDNFKAGIDFVMKNKELFSLLMWIIFGVNC